MGLPRSRQERAVIAVADWEDIMLRKEQNDLLTQTGPGTPMGEMFRRYWIPALLAEELRGKRRPAGARADSVRTL